VHAIGGRGLQAFLEAGEKFIDETVQVSAVNLLVNKGNSPRRTGADLMGLALKTIDPRYTVYGGFGYWMNAHSYFLSNFPDRMEAFFERFPNVSIDLTPSIEMFDGFTKQRDRWIQFYIKYQDRILFGTDNAVRPFEQNVGHDGSYYDRIAYMRHFLETDDKFEAWGYNLHGFALPRA